MKFVFPPVLLTVCITRIYTTMYNSWFLDVTKGDGNCCILNSQCSFNFFFCCCCARQTWLYLFGKSPAHVPSSQAINSSRWKTKISGYAVQLLRWTVFLNARNTAKPHPLHHSDWWRWCHWFWHYHELLEDFDCKICVCNFFFFFKHGGVSYVFTESTQTYFFVIVQMSIGNGKKKTLKTSQTVQAGRNRGRGVTLWKCNVLCFYLRFVVI